ncbi:MAG: VWA domain-containing protein [Verrucomicrobiota bacterium]
MSFLFPLYLLGAAVVAIPILLHLRRRPPKERTEFSSLMFLRATPAPLKRRRKLDQLLLLLLRCALILLLAFLFARPFFRGEGILAGAGKGEWVVVLLDKSGSMQREDLWERAVERTKSVVAERSNVERGAVVVFDGSAETVMGFDEWAQLDATGREDAIGERLAEKEAGWGSSAAGPALALAVELVEEAQATGEVTPESAAVILVSDLQAGMDFAGLELVNWPEDVVLELEGVDAKSADNAWLQLLVAERVLAVEEESSETAAVDSEEGMRVRVSNAAESGAETFEVGWEGGAGEEISVMPGRRRTVMLEDSGEAGATALVLAGDGQDFDNRYFVSRTMKRPLRILWMEEKEVDGNDAAGPLFYLSRAVQATRLHEPWVGQDVPPGGRLAGSVDFVVVGSGLGDEEAAMVKAYLEGGGEALMLLRGAEQGALLGRLAGMATAPVVEDALVEKDYVLLEGIDFEDALLAVFDDQRVRNFSKVRFWRYRRLAEGSEWPEGTQVLARFDSGDPAWLSVPVGEGRLIVFASGWEPVDSQLALSTKFVPLVYGMLEGGERTSGRIGGQLLVGDAIPVAGGDVVWRPDGESVTVGAEAAYYVETDEPGVYRVESGDGDEERRYAVNVAPAESRTGPMDPAVFAANGVRLAGADGVSSVAEETVAAAHAVAGEERRQELLREDRERRQRGWRWLAIGALVVVLLETFWAGRASREPTSAEAV